MIAASYYCNRVVGTLLVRALPLLLLFACASLQAQAQQVTLDSAERFSTRHELSDDVKTRISTAIAAKRQLKEAAGPAAVKSAASQQAILAARSQLDRIAAVTQYSDGYTDTFPGNDFSFPEDTHDYCRAYFNDTSNSEFILQDYYLNMEFLDGETLVIDLNWEAVDGGFADFDLYVFDSQGYPVGDTDPAALLDGTNENEFQTDNTNLVETATATNNSGATQTVLVVIDRFRSSSPDVSSAVTLNIEGSDEAGAFSVVEYIQPDALTYVDEMGANQSFPNDLVLTTNEAADFMASLDTEGCARSVVFTLVDAEGNPFVGADTTSLRPFSAFSAETVSLTPGDYTLTALPYSAEDGIGVEAPLIEVMFSVTESDPAWIDLPVDSTGIPELTTFDFTVLATSSEPGPITYSINPEAEALGIEFTSDGQFSWTPIESLGAGVYDVTFSASNGTNTTDSTITFVVNEVNLAPELAEIANQGGLPGDLISFTATATDADTLAPAPFTFNTLTYSLEGGETGMVIDPVTGEFSWTPAEAGTFTVTVVVTDDGDPNLSDSQEVTFTVNIDDPQWIVLPADGTPIDELTLFADSVQAISSEPGPITYTINPEAEALGIEFTPDGQFSWTPPESVGAGTYDVTFTATNGTNSTDSTITFVVNEVNLAPELATLADQAGAEGDLIAFTATATDADTLAPAPFTFNTLTFSLEGEQDGMVIDPETGEFSWTPDTTGTFTVTVVVTDDGEPNLSDSQEITITIGDPVSIGIDNFTLINALTNEPVPGYDPIEDGAIIDLVTISMGDGVPIVSGLNDPVFNIRANVTDPGGEIESIDFALSVTPVLNDPVDAVPNDPGPPYSIYQEVDDNGSPNYNAQPLVMGTYNLSGTPVGAALTDPVTSTVNFLVIGPRIENFTLVNSADNVDIDGIGEEANYSPIANDTTIFLSQVGTSLNIRANTVDFPEPVIESAQFVLTGPGAPADPFIESFTPYALFGDPTTADIPPPFTDANYNTWPSIQAGFFTLTATPFSEDFGNGFSLAPASLTFTVDNTTQGAPGSNAFATDTPGETQLLPNYPNPFNPITTIRFGLEEAAAVRITVYDMIGREVAVLVDGELSTGFHEVSFDAAGLPSGMYLYRLETPTLVQVRPMTLLK